MLTQVETVVITTSTGQKAISIRDNHTHRLMKNRLTTLLREYKDISADKKLGEELLAQAALYHTKYQHAQEVNRSKQCEINHLRRKIKQNEAFFVALFGPLPASYLEVINLQ